MFVKDLFIRLCALTGLTETAARLLSVQPFLPRLFRLRYANMGEIDPDLFSQQLKACRSFNESKWRGKGFLKLYENDDHCVMGHCREWLAFTFEWLNMQFKR